MVAVLVGLLAGPLLPGSTDPVLDLRRLGQPGDSRTVISPFVGVRAQLGPQSNAEMFDVVSPVGAYWRLTSLERYDERRNIWVSEGTYARSDGNLDASPAGARSITQKFSINSLATIWLPAAFEPKAIRDSSVSVSYDKDSSSLIARGVTLEQGNQFTIQSVLPDLQAAALGGTAEGSDLDAVYHQKADLDPAVEALTRRIVASAVTPYDKALALQNYFRDGFIYDESVNYSDDADPVAAFLRDRRGFCQQFASTYALMARSIGLASRVAVGFTPGDPLDPAEAEAAGREVPAGSADFVVRGRHAHAWPEVYFDKVGWVPFEPTPGRGNPQASDYTGVAAGPGGGAGRPGGDHHGTDDDHGRGRGNRIQRPQRRRIRPPQAQRIGRLVLGLGCVGHDDPPGRRPAGGRRPWRPWSAGRSSTPVDAPVADMIRTGGGWLRRGRSR